MLATKNEGMELCKILHESLSQKGFYPALTGGLLYKDGARKDIDIIIYRNRQQHAGFEMHNIEHDLNECGVFIDECYGFVTKAKWKGFTIDLFNPESTADFSDGEYLG